MKKFDYNNINLITILLFGLLLTCYFTFPLVLNLNSYYGQDSDYFINGWTYWYTAKSIITGEILNINHFFNAPILYPFPNILSQLDFTLLPSALLYLPSYLVFKNHILSLNIAIFASYLLNFISCYLCLNSMLKNKYSSILGAIVFSFSPNVIQLLTGHLEYLNRFFIPPYFLYLYRYYKNPSKNNIVILSIIYTLLWFTSIQIAIFITFTTLLSWLIFITIEFKYKQGILNRIINSLKFLPIILMFAPLVVYFFGSYYKYSSRENLTRPKFAAEYYSASKYDFFIPFPNNRLSGNLALKFEEIRRTYTKEISFNYLERTLFPGFLVLILFPLFIYIKSKSNDKRWLFYFWILVFNIAFSFGPYLHIFGSKFKFIYGYLYDISPLLTAIRTPTRIQYVWLFLLSYIFADGIKLIISKSNNYYKHILFLIALILLVIDYSTRFEVIKTSRLTINKINYDLNNKVVLFLPIQPYYSFLNDAKYNIYQIKNNFISINGSTGTEQRINGYKELSEALNNNTFSHSWYNVLKTIGVEYVLIDKDNFKVPLVYNYPVEYTDDKWLILNIKDKTNKFPINCTDTQALNQQLSFEVSYDTIDKTLLLKYFGHNFLNCDIFFKPALRYRKFNYTFYKNNKLVKSTKYIPLPTFVLGNTDFSDFVILEYDLDTKPLNIDIKYQGDYLKTYNII